MFIYPSKIRGDDQFRWSLRCCAPVLALAVTLCCAGCTRLASPAAAPPVGELEQLSKDVAFLADPQQEGRGLNTAGQHRAGEMLEARFKSLGLSSALADNSFRQPFSTPSTNPATTQPIAMFNVMAQRTGQQSDEFIIVGAHYDHLGYGGRGSVVPWSHELHPGADDNASGTAAVLALAGRVAAGPQPRRTVVFVFFAGEERGLLGSDWFVRHAPMPLSKIVAMVNFDMVGRLRDERLYIGGERTADVFVDLVRAADVPVDLTLKVFSLGGNGPSDHRAFSERHVPVLFFFTGLHADYHTPRDRAEAVNYEGLDRIVTLATNCLARLSELPFPRYRQSNDLDATILTAVSLRPKACLGIEIEPIARDGVVVGRVKRGSPALNAGIHAGDVLIEMDRKPIHDFQEFNNLMALAMPGDEVRLTIRRDGKMFHARAFLTEKKD